MDCRIGSKLIKVVQAANGYNLCMFILCYLSHYSTFTLHAEILAQHEGQKRADDEE